MIVNVIATDFEYKSIRPDAKTVGIVSGTFAPFHAGHARLVKAARCECDLVIVVAGGHEHDRGESYGFPQKERYKRLRYAFEDDRDVMVAMLDERSDHEFSDPEGLAQYHDGIIDIVGIYAPNAEHIRNYVGQADYLEVLNAAYPDFENVLVERSYDTDGSPDSDEDIISSLSATAIREDPYRYWRYISPAFKYRYRRAYVLAGGMSTGKTTLALSASSELNARTVSDMSHLPAFCLPVYEQARKYTEGWRHVIESDLDERDYLAFIADQLTAMEDAKSKRGWDQAVLIDTDGVVTKQYIENGDEDIDPAYKDALSRVCDISIDWTRDNVSLVFILPNDVPFEMDGSRDGHIEGKRDEFREQLIGRYEDVCPGRVVLVPEGTRDEKVAFIADAIEEDFARAAAESYGKA